MQQGERLDKDLQRVKDRSKELEIAMSEKVQCLAKPIGGYPISWGASPPQLLQNKQSDRASLIISIIS